MPDPLDRPKIERNMIRFKCIACGEQYEVDTRHAGKRTKCAKCKTSLIVPHPNSSGASISQTATSTSTTPVPNVTSPQSMTLESNVQVSLDQDKPNGIQGFFRAFGLTSGVLAAIAFVAIGVPIVMCGGFLVSMMRIGDKTTTAPVQTTINKSLPGESNQNTETGVVNSSQKTPRDTLSNAAPNSPQPTPPESVPTKAQPTPSEAVPGNPRQTQSESLVSYNLPSVNLVGRDDIFVFNDLTVTIKDKYINDVRIVDLNGRPVTADVLFENTSGANWKPRITLEFINGYGVVLGTSSIFWALAELESNKRYTESISYHSIRFEEVFRYAPIYKPLDFDKPKYLRVSYR